MGEGGRRWEKAVGRRGKAVGRREKAVGWREKAVRRREKAGGGGRCTYLVEVSELAHEALILVELHLRLHLLESRPRREKV